MRASYDGHKRRKGRKTHLAVDTLGHLLAVHVTPANAQERAQAVTGSQVEMAFVDQSYTDKLAETDAAAQGIRLELVKLPEAKRGFVVLPRRWVVERSFAWLAKFRRLARDDERLPKTVATLHVVAFACLMLHRVIPLLTQRAYHVLACEPVLEQRSVQHWEQGTDDTGWIYLYNSGYLLAPDRRTIHVSFPVRP